MISSFYKTYFILIYPHSINEKLKYSEIKKLGQGQGASRW